MAFPTGFDTVSSLSGNVKALYDSAYAMAYDTEAVWAQSQWINWLQPIADDGTRGSSLTFNVYNQVAPITSAATETTDPDPVTQTNGQVTVTPDEFINAIGWTRKLSLQSFDDIKKEAAENTAINQAQSIDYLVRTAVVAAPYVFRPNSNVLRTGLDATSDKISYAFLAMLVASARARGVRPVDGHNFASIINPMLEPDIMATAEWLAVKEYSDAGDLYNGEVGSLAGVRFVSHPWGRMYLSGGTVLQTATTVNNSGVIAAGDTSFVVTSATGLSVGDFITVGALGSALAEQVQITVVASTTLTIRGGGSKEGNQGFRFGHADAVAVTEAPNVCAIPIIGKNSVYGTYAAELGKKGKNGLKAKDTNVPNRFWNTWWAFYGGFGIRQAMLYQGEVAVANGILGAELTY